MTNAQSSVREDIEAQVLAREVARRYKLLLDARKGPSRWYPLIAWVVIAIVFFFFVPTFTPQIQHDPLVFYFVILFTCIMQGSDMIAHRRIDALIDLIGDELLLKSRGSLPSKTSNQVSGSD